MSEELSLMAQPDIRIEVNGEEWSQHDLVDALIRRDEKLTHAFFFRKCMPMFITIIDRIFDYHVDYDEFVNELYLYLMRPGKDGQEAHVLRAFSFRSSLFTWLNRVAIRFFIRNKNLLIGNVSQASLYSQSTHTTYEQIDVDAQMQVEQLFQLMMQGKGGQRLKDTERYILVIRRLEIEGCSPQQVADELHIRTEAVYNIRTRAMKALRRVALKEGGR